MNKQDDFPLEVVSELFSTHGFDHSMVIDLISTVIAAKLLEKGVVFRNVDDVNKLVAENYPELVFEGKIPESILSLLNKLDASKLNIYKILHLGKRESDLMDFDPKYAADLAALIRINKSGKIANINCASSTIFREIIRQNRYDGEVHLYSRTKLPLKISFISIYPLNKNIFLHHEDVMANTTYGEVFDFIYATPRLNESAEFMNRYISICENKLSQNGRLTLITASGFLSTSKYNHTRKMLYNNFNIEAVVSVLNAYKPYTTIGIAFILLDKSKSNQIDGENSRVFLAQVDLTSSADETLKVILDAYNDHLNGKTTQNIVPMTNTIDKHEYIVDKDQFNVDFDVKRFSPQILRLENNIKKKYELVNLGDICDILSGGRGYTSNEYLDHSSKDSSPYLRIQDISGGRINISSAKKVLAKDTEDKFTEPGDILLSISGTIGKTGMVNRESANSLISSGLIILRPKHDQIEPNYLYHMLGSRYVQLQFENQTTGDYIPHISRSSINRLQIPILPVEHQRKIVANIDLLEKELSALLQREKLVRDKLKSLVEEAFE